MPILMTVVTAGWFTQRVGWVLLGGGWHLLETQPDLSLCAVLQAGPPSELPPHHRLCFCPCCPPLLQQDKGALRVSVLCTSDGMCQNHVERPDLLWLIWGVGRIHNGPVAFTSLLGQLVGGKIIFRLWEVHILQAYMTTQTQDKSRSVVFFHMRALSPPKWVGWARALSFMLSELWLTSGTMEWTKGAKWPDKKERHYRRTQPDMLHTLTCFL